MSSPPTPASPSGSRILAEALDHVLYEMEMLHALPALLEASDRDVRQNAYLESFIVHARCLDEFFAKASQGQTGRNMRASDFAPFLKPVSLPDSLIDRMNREITHLGWTRKKPGTVGDCWKCSDVIAQLMKPALDFLDAVYQIEAIRSFGKNQSRIEAMRQAFVTSRPQTFVMKPERLYSSSAPPQTMIVQFPPLPPPERPLIDFTRP